MGLAPLTDPAGSARPSLTSLRRAIRRFVQRHRRAIAASLAALAVLAVVAAIRPETPPLTRVVIATRDLPAGSLLTPEDLSTAETSTPPPGSFDDAAQAVGEVITAPLAAGEAVTPTRLLSHAFDHDPDRVAVPVRLADPGVALLLEPGQSLDLVAPGGRTLARDARVVTVPRTETNTFGGTRAGSIVLVAVAPGDATRLAGSAADAVSPILR